MEFAPPRRSRGRPDFFCRRLTRKRIWSVRHGDKPMSHVHHDQSPTFSERLSRRYLSRLLAHPKGRAHLLTSLADAEANGEGAVFDRLLSRVDDPQLQKMIRRHAQDEIRHAAMFRACAARAGAEPDPIPS